MPAPKRRTPTKKQPPAEQPAATPEETLPQDLTFVRDETVTDAPEWPTVASPLTITESVPVPVEEEAPVPDHVRTLARTVRRHLGNPRIHFDAAQGVPVMFGYKSLYHVATNGHPQTHIATRDELSEMSDQQIYDRVMQGRQPPRQGYPTGGR